LEARYIQFPSIFVYPFSVTLAVIVRRLVPDLPENFQSAFVSSAPTTFTKEKGRGGVRFATSLGLLLSKTKTTRNRLIPNALLAISLALSRVSQRLIRQGGVAPLMNQDGEALTTMTRDRAHEPYLVSLNFLKKVPESLRPFRPPTSHMAVFSS
jgi:hypothetical protein